jgi:hypothetical protein
LALSQNWDSSAIPLSTNKYIGKRRWVKLMFCTSRINGSEDTPIELFCWGIYTDNNYQLKGVSSRRISRFSTAAPLLV